MRVHPFTMAAHPRPSYYLSRAESSGDAFRRPQYRSLNHRKLHSLMFN